MTPTSEPGATDDPILDALERARHLLPAQGPIDVFIHHNTLHAFQHLPFEQALAEGVRVFGAEPYLSEARYREELARGRITEAELDAELLALEGSRLPDLPPEVDLRALRKATLLHGLEEAEGPALAWLLEEKGLVRRLHARVPEATRRQLVFDTRDWLSGDIGDPAGLARALTGEPDVGRCDAWLLATLDSRTADVAALLWRDPEAIAAAALWAACLRRSAAIPIEPAPPPVRHRDRLLALTGEDSDIVVHGLLIRWCSAYLDQGLAHWPLPGREAGFFAAFRELYRQGLTLEEPCLRGLRAELHDLAARRVTPQAACLEVLDSLGVPAAGREEQVTRALLALPGWGGMFSILERRPPQPGSDARPALIDLLAVRLLIERRALLDLARRHLGPDTRLDALPPAPKEDVTRARERLAFRLRQQCELLGLSARVVNGWTDAQARAVLAEEQRFSSFERRGVWQRAYERHHRGKILDALAARRRRFGPPDRAPPGRLQVVFCIDDRSEGIRRHLEELGPRFETFGGPGFFALPIEFRGIDDARHSTLCPIVLRPEHEVQERPHRGDTGLHARRRARRRALAFLGRGSAIGSRSLLGGILATLGLGLLSLVPLIARTLGPRLWARLSRWIAGSALPMPRTELTALREDDASVGPTGKRLGFSADEAAARVARLLEDTGLAGRTGPLVAIVGHGSSTTNNPHASAYECGACGGRRGSPNARLFARLANDPSVRERLPAHGVELPSGTWFVGALHDTTTDGFEWLDRELLPESHRPLLEELAAAIERARRLNAHERCRRFESAPEGLSPDEALLHVEARAAHLAEPRPEYNHGTNAVCVVGRRALTRGLFLDRRSFLVSYDPTRDPEARLLERILGAVLPVCAGINLEYYFSTVDNERYGCGTKLPHNVVGLLGVMNGFQSDLRTGLPWQTLDIHEPVRLLTVVEASPAAILAVLERHAEVAELVRGRWIQVVSLDPETGAMQWWGPRGFEPHVPRAVEPPSVRTSPEWYAGRTEHLDPAFVLSGLEGSA